MLVIPNSPQKKISILGAESIANQIVLVNWPLKTLYGIKKSNGLIPSIRIASHRILFSHTPNLPDSLKYAEGAKIIIEMEWNNDSVLSRLLFSELNFGVNGLNRNRNIYLSVANEIIGYHIVRYNHTQSHLSI